MTRKSNTEPTDGSEAAEPQDNDETRRDTAGRGWHGNPEGHAEAGRKGGQSISQNRQHMADIGKKGGTTVSKNRSHMAEIGRKGGKSRGKKTTGDKEE